MDSLKGLLISVKLKVEDVDLAVVNILNYSFGYIEMAVRSGIVVINSCMFIERLLSWVGILVLIMRRYRSGLRLVWRYCLDVWFFRVYFSH